jgi:RNA polymerase sigma-70 factor, ECF subfamily
VAARKKAARASGVGPPEGAHDPTAPAGDDPAHAGEDPRTALARVLACLSDAHREAVMLRFVDGLSLAEIAEATGVPLGTVKSRLHHALRSLREDPAAKKYFQA